MDKIICVGKNYLEHAKELGDSVPESPVFFFKPPSTALFLKEWEETVFVPIPRNRGEVHPECEIILLLNAQKQIEAVSLGLDMTLRDVQSGLKKKGHPWEISKVFPFSAVIGPWIPISQFPRYLEETFTFSVDSKIKQSSQGKEMRFSPEFCIEYATQLFPICKGDILFTGTPAGISAVNPGQIAELQWGERYRFKVIFK